VKHRLENGAVLLARRWSLAIGWLGWEAARRSVPAARGQTAVSAGPKGILGGCVCRWQWFCRARRLILFGLLVILPGSAGVALGLHALGRRWRRARAVGFFNFKWLLLESDTFWYALRNNLYIMVVPTLVVVPLIAAAGDAHPSRRLGREFFPRGFPFSQSARRYRCDAAVDERLRSARRSGERGAGENRRAGCTTTG
jgi:hypothetical protein